MKKLLNLLSVLTIGGTAVPTTVATNPYKIKENKLENSEINFKKNNNLKKLTRVKRRNNIPYTEIYWVNSDTNFRKETDVPYPVTTMYTFTSDRGNRKNGDIYFGTTNGVYLRKAGATTATKIDGINGFIAIITPHTNEYNDTHVIKIVSDSETTELVRRQNNNYRLVINNDDDEWKAVISNILNNNYEYYGNSQSERNIRVTSRGFNDYRQSFANIITNLVLTNNNNFVRNNDQNWWTINPQIGHFIIEVSFTQSSSTSNRLELVFSRQNLYLTGFIYNKKSKWK